MAVAEITQGGARRRIKRAGDLSALKGAGEGKVRETEQE